MPSKQTRQRTAAAEPARRLRGLERGLLAYERRHGSSVGIGLLARFDGPAPEPDRLRAHLADRLAATPELRWVLRGSAWCENRDFSWDASIVDHIGSGPRDTVAALVSRPLDPAVSPWRIWLLRDFAAGQWALLFHVHHALADGLSMMRLARRALGAVPAAPRPSRTWIAVEHPSRTRAWASLVRGAPRQLWSLLPRRLPGPAVSAGHAIDWTGIDTTAARELARRHEATVNDVVLATIAHALPRRAVTALVPVGLDTDPARIGNDVAMFRVRLPAGHRDPARLLRATAAATSRAKQGSDIAASRAGLRLLPQRVQNRVLDLGLAHTALDLVVSNWGTSPPLSFDDDPVRELVPIMFRPVGHPLTIGFATHADRTHLGLVTAAGAHPIGDPATAFAELCAVPG